jgi:hypothetical protein
MFFEKRNKMRLIDLKKSLLITLLIVLPSVLLSSGKIAYYTTYHYDKDFDKTVECYIERVDTAECEVLLSSKKFENAIHESAHILMFKPIVEQEKPYSEQILSSLRVGTINEQHKGYETVARTFAQDTVSPLSVKEIEQRMRMFMSGDIAFYIVSGIKKPYYLEVTIMEHSDMFKWYKFAKQKLNLNIKESKAIKMKHELETTDYIRSNMSLLFRLARIFYKNNEITNREIRQIIKNG